MAERRHAILAVDDESDILDSLRWTFEEDYDVRVATSGFDALEILRREPVSVIVADQRMPEMTGAEFLAQAAEIAPKAMRIMLTGYTDMDALIAAVNAGQIYRYIAKPWEPEELRMEIQRAVERFEMAAELDRRFEEIARLNHELEEARQKLELENAELRHVAQSQFQFDGMNNPLNHPNHHFSLADSILYTTLLSFSQFH